MMTRMILGANGVSGVESSEDAQIARAGVAAPGRAAAPHEEKEERREAFL